MHTPDLTTRLLCVHVALEHPSIDHYYCELPFQQLSILTNWQIVQLTVIMSGMVGACEGLVPFRLLPF